MEATPTHIHDIPFEVLGQIFAFLPIANMAAVSLVCHRWRNACWQWRKTLDISRNDRISKKDMAFLKQQIGTLDALYLRDCPRLHNDSLPIIASMGMRILKLEFMNHITEGEFTSRYSDS